MKKESVRGVVKQMVRALSAMVKRKSRALKARLIIHSLLSNTNFLQLTRQHHHCQLHNLQQQQQAVELEEEEEGGRSGGSSSSSVIEMVKHSKEEAGEEFCLEQDIDHVAELFITNFHRQMRMQNHNMLAKASIAQQ